MNIWKRLFILSPIWLIAECSLLMNVEQRAFPVERPHNYEFLSKNSICTNEQICPPGRYHDEITFDPVGELSSLNTYLYGYPNEGKGFQNVDDYLKD